jgi:predicted CXXCH cytochrome family protein
VPPTCAKCHSGNGFIDYIGQDGSQVMAVDRPAAVESVITCAVCHSEKADALTLVKFPSGIEMDFHQGDALCATCHSGLASGLDVDSVIAEYGDDEIIPDASFVTPHYAFAAATLLGGEAQGGYEYPQKAYVNRFEHAEGVRTCTDCHDPHTLHMNESPVNKDADLCSACHSNVTGFADYRDIFVDGVDYDNDGEVEGMYHEIRGLRDILMTAMQQYSEEITGSGLGWADQFPYLFIDTNKDRVLSEDEAQFSNAFTAFTPRLLRAAFNYQFSLKEPAGYVHNGKYIVQLLNDSIKDISSGSGFSIGALIRPASE